MRVVVTAAAARDLDEAVAWYELQQAGLGGALLQAVDTAVSRIAEHPLSCRVVGGDVRLALTPTFPYGIFYRVKGDEAQVIAILHGARDPATFRRRS